jgi:hypothetical protein
MVYYNTLATVKCQIQQAENPMPAVVISLEAARVDNAVHLDYSTSEMALEKPEIGNTDRNIPIDKHCMVDKVEFGMPGGSGVNEDDGDESDDRDAIPTASRRQRPATDLARFDLETSDVAGYEGEDGDDAAADADEDEEASLVGNG